MISHLRAGVRGRIKQILSQTARSSQRGAIRPTLPLGADDAPRRHSVGAIEETRSEATEQKSCHELQPPRPLAVQYLHSEAKNQGLSRCETAVGRLLGSAAKSPLMRSLHKKIGRGGRIRTSGLLVPNQALYQAEPRPEPFECSKPKQRG